MRDRPRRTGVVTQQVAHADQRRVRLAVSSGGRSGTDVETDLVLLCAGSSITHSSRPRSP